MGYCSAFATQGFARKEQTPFATEQRLLPFAVNRVHISLSHPWSIKIKRKQGVSRCYALFSGGKDGIRTHVPGYRQPHFECGSLRPLRYLSVLLLNLITILLKITNGFYYTLKYSKMQAIINKLSIINKLFSKYKYAYKTCFLLINYYIIYPLLMKNF